MFKVLSYMFLVGGFASLSAAQEIQIKVKSSSEAFRVEVDDGTKSFRCQEFGNTTWLLELSDKVEKSSAPYRPSSMAAYAACALKEVFVPGFTEAYSQCQAPRERAYFLKKGCQLVDTFFHDDDLLKKKVREHLEQDFPEHQDSWINHLMNVSALCHRCIMPCLDELPVYWYRHKDDPNEDLNRLHKSIMRQIGYSSNVEYHWPSGTTSNHGLVQHKGIHGIDFGSLFGFRF